MDDWPPYQPKHYTTLALIHSRGKSPDAAVISVTQELAAAGNIAESLTSRNIKKQSMVTKKISDIFLPAKAVDGTMKDPNMILIEGAPGIGKTVLAKEIAYQWAKSNLLGNKQLLFLLFLREVHINSIVTIEDFVQYINKSKVIVDCLAKYLFQTEGKNLAIIFDGYDEMSDSDRKNSFIADIIHRKVFSQCCLIITSRPTTSSHLHNLVDRRVEIVGFTDKDRLDYIQTALEGCTDQVDALKHYLQFNPTINALCYIPLNMTILLCLAEDGVNNLPKTQTNMYKKFIETTIRRFIRKSDEKNTVNIVDITDLPYPHNEVFKELAHLAFEALKTDKIVFTLAEIRSSCPNLTITSVNWNGLGLLKAARHFDTQSGNEDVTFHFLHFSIQEYMAAYYISTLSDRKQIKLLKKTFWDHRYYNTWIMYVGLTGAASFAFKHFLSGHSMQIITKLFPTFKLSSRLLNDKVKCLHLFQCLEESKSKDVEGLAEKLLQGQEIDLSNQTLLPSDLNTIGFFLCRSINKEWEVLNLSGCNIGVTGCDILCNRFLDKQNRDIIVVKKVDLSFNQLTFSCFCRLVELLKSWRTSEAIISDETVHSDIITSSLVTTIEENLLHSGTPKLVLFGSFLFATHLEQDHLCSVLSRANNISSIYLLNCRLNLRNYKLNEILLALFKKQKLTTVHIMGTDMHHEFLGAVASILLDNTKVGRMFIFDSSLSDHSANEVKFFSPIFRKRNSGVMLVIGSGKITGALKIKKLSLNSELSSLEILNLCIQIRYPNQVNPWKEVLYFDIDKVKLFILTIMAWLHVITKNDQLQIVLIENGILIAHNVKFDEVVKSSPPEGYIFSVYLSNCDMNVLKYGAIFQHCSTLLVCNAHFTKASVDLLNFRLQNGWSLKELFIHATFEANINDVITILTKYCHDTSLLVVTNDLMIGHNPTTKQIALAFQLEPSITVWKLPNCRVTADVFYQLMSWLTTVPNNWIELNFEGCNITDTECEIIHKCLKSGFHSTVKTLNISSAHLTTSVVSKLVDIILIFKVQECKINCTDVNAHKNLIFEITKAYSLFESQHKINIIFDYSWCFINNVNWNKMPLLDDQIKEVYFINCHIPSVQLNHIMSWLSRVTFLLKVFVINCTVPEAFLFALFEKYISTSLEISICDTTFNDTNLEVSTSDATVTDITGTLYDFINSNSIPYCTNMSVVVLSDHCLCGFNVTKQQLRLLQQFTKHTVEQTIVKIVQELKPHKGLFLCHNGLLEALHFIGKDVRQTNNPQINVLQNYVTALKRFGLDDYRIDDDDFVDDIATILGHNSKLVEAYFNHNDLEEIGSLRIMCSLKNKSSLKVFSFTYNQITAILAGEIASVVSHNIELEAFDISNSEIDPSDANKILCALQDCDTLKVLRMANTNLNNASADLIASVIHHNVQLEELDCSKNCIQANGCTAICAALGIVSALKKLCIGSNSITDEATDDIVDILSINTQLEELDIGNNILKTRNMMKILSSMQLFTSLKVFRISNCSIGSEAAELLECVLCDNVQLQELDLSGNHLQSKGCIVICRGLQQVSTLTKLYLSNNDICDEAADNMASVLSHNKQLKVLHLDGNSFQENGIRKIASALKHTSTISALHIGNNNISNEAVDDIADIISHNIQLQELELQVFNFLPTYSLKISKSLQYTSSLLRLIIINSNLTSKSADSIAAILSHNTQLQELNLDGNYLNGVGMVKICRALKNTSNLVKLSIQDNHCTNDVAHDIASVISHNTGLQELNLQGNDLQTDGVNVIVKVLQEISTLLTLNIDGICDQSADCVADFLCKNLHLKELGLNKNKLTKHGFAKIVNIVMKLLKLKVLRIANSNFTDSMANSLAEILLHCVKLQELDLRGNNFQARGCSVLCKALQQTSTLTKLYLGNNNITDEAADCIVPILLANIHIKELDISNNLFQTTSTIKFIKTIGRFRLLQVLRMSGCKLNEAAKLLAIALFHSLQLQELDLSKNNLNAEQCSAICKSLRVSTLKRFYLNENNITDEAADDIGDVLSINTDLKELDVSNNMFEAASTIKFVEIIGTFHQLQVLRMSGCSVNGTAKLLAHVLYNNSKQLQELDLSKNHLNAEQFSAICKSLRVLTLKKLYLNKNFITDEAADDFASVLSINTDIKELDFSNNKFQGISAIKFIKIIQTFHQIQVLRMSGCGLNAASKLLTDGFLCYSEQLQELDLSKNHLNAEQCSTICKSLKVLTLKRFYLHENDITDEAADDIANVLLHNTQLQIFNVAQNLFETVGIRSIAKGLQKISTLTHLYLGNNSISNEAVDDIADVLSCNTKLQGLELQIQNLHACKALKISEALRCTSTLLRLIIIKSGITSESADSIADVLSHNTHLQELNLDGNFLQAEGIKKVMKSLRNTSTLVKLSITDNVCTEDAADDIADVISHNTGLQELILQGNDLRAEGAIVIAKALQKIVTLIKLDINNNEISDEATYELMVALRTNTQIKSLSFSGNRFTKVDIEMIQNSVETNIYDDIDWLTW